MDTYQAVYDAVRSKLSNGDIGSAVEDALRSSNFAHHAEMAAETIRMVAIAYERPSVLFRPHLFVDGDQWCALYGADIQTGVVGFGDTPEAAMCAFDKAWSTPVQKMEMK